MTHLKESRRMIKVTFQPRTDAEKRFTPLPEGERKIKISEASLGKTKNGRDCVNLYLTTIGKSGDISTKHVMLLDSFEFENLCRALLQNFRDPEDKNTFNFEPGFIEGKWIIATVKHTVSAQGMTFNDLKNIKSAETKEDLPF
jgi:hypothetical protein